MPNRITPVFSNYQGITLALLTPRTIFSPASNTKGVKIISGSCSEWQAGNGFGHFVIATSAPATMGDGLVVSKIITLVPGAQNMATYQIVDNCFIPAGYGLYWISSITSSANGTFTDVSWADA